MREFGRPIDSTRRAKITQLARDFYEKAPSRRVMAAEAFALDGDGSRPVATEAEYKWEEGRMRVAMSRPEERPPFEWRYEISSDIGEADYFKHYLIRDDDIVLAQRKVLTVIDDAEADVLEQDLMTALAAL